MPRFRIVYENQKTGERTYRTEHDKSLKVVKATLKRVLKGSRTKVVSITPIRKRQRRGLSYLGYHIDI